MTVFSAALSALNLSHAEAAEVLGLSVGSVKDISSRRRGAYLSDKGWSRLCGLFEMIEQATDEIIADQAELDGGAGIVPLAVDVAAIHLETRALRELAVARAMLVLGPRLMTIIEET